MSLHHCGWRAASSQSQDTPWFGWKQAQVKILMSFCISFSWCLESEQVSTQVLEVSSSLMQRSHTQKKKNSPARRKYLSKYMQVCRYLSMRKYSITQNQRVCGQDARGRLLRSAAANLILILRAVTIRQTLSFLPPPAAILAEAGCVCVCVCVYSSTSIFLLVLVVYY